MGKYGAAAVRAVEHFRSGRTLSIVDAWNVAVSETFPHSPSSQAKGCPRGTFLGLCEIGYVVGVPPGAYTKSALNKAYGQQAVVLLRQNAALAKNPAELWTKVQAGVEKTPNHQMDIVIALWNCGLVA